MLKTRIDQQIRSQLLFKVYSKLITHYFIEIDSEYVTPKMLGCYFMSNRNLYKFLIIESIT